MFKEYSDKEYVNAYLSLNDEQRYVLDNFIKIGYKTKWLYILAKKKGLIQSEDELVSMSHDNLERLSKDLEWDLIDYVDYLNINPNVRCECGRALRHAYTIKHNLTGKIYVLGKDHFQQHTMINPDDVKNVFKNFKLIDLEKTELLNKIIENRDFDIDKKINDSYEIPKDMVLQLALNLPLLDRQIKRLESSGAFSDYFKSIPKEVVIEEINKQKPSCESIESSPKLKVIDFEDMMVKLETNTWTAEEAELYLSFSRYHSSKIDRIQFDRKRMRKALYNTCSKLPANSKFKSLIVDIGFSIFPDF